MTHLNDCLERKESVDLWKEETSIGCESSCFVLLTSSSLERLGNNYYKKKQEAG